MAEDGPRLKSALTYINKSDDLGGFGESFVAGAGGLMLAIFSILIGIGEALATLITRPTSAFSNVTALLIDAGFGAPARFLRDAWNTAAIALGQDPWMSLGPFVAVLAGGTVVATVGVLTWYTDLIDADTLTGIDLPIVQRDVAGDTDDEN